jgi:hypothetical protein
MRQKGRRKSNGGCQQRPAFQPTRINIGAFGQRTAAQGGDRPFEAGASDYRNAPGATVPETSYERAHSNEAVRKHGEFLRLAEQREVLRDFSASERSEGSKKRTK